MYVVATGHLVSVTNFKGYQVMKSEMFKLQNVYATKCLCFYL